jgi:hypothetical protein
MQEGKMANNLWDKRRKSLLKIAAAAGANIAFTGAPKPGAELPTQVALTATDFVMCAMVYEEYFGERISTQGIYETLGAAGVLVAVAGGGGYIIAKSASGLIAEVTNWLGPIGWLASSLLAFGGTAALGVIWMAMVDYAYREGKSPSEAAHAMA